jgi:hypothetical protein
MAKAICFCCLLNFYGSRQRLCARQPIYSSILMYSSSSRMGGVGLGLTLFLAARRVGIPRGFAQNAKQSQPGPQNPE